MKQDQRFKFKKILLPIVACVLMLAALALVPMRAHAAEKQKTVKIGWYYSALFQEGMSNEEIKSGYAYGYIQKVADYNGWVYEYVYGEWADLLQKLQTGEIDILAGVSKTEERMETILYPYDAMGEETYALFQHDTNRTMDPEDIQSFEGKKIGAIRNNRMTTCLETWLEENGAEAELIMYDGFPERDLDFQDNKLDGVVATDNNILMDTGYALVAKVGEEPYYLAISRNNPALLKELNDALTLLKELDPYFLQNLQYSSYGTTLTNSMRSELEEEWLVSHDVLKLGYMEDYLPYCATDQKGNPDGLITDVMTAMLSELRIDDRVRVEYRSFSDHDSMIAALQSGEIDAAFPVSNTSWVLEKDHIRATSTIISAGMDLVYRGSYSAQKTERIAVNRNNSLQENYVRTVFPEATRVEYDSIEECLDGVYNGKADSTVLNGLRTGLVRDNRAYDRLNLLQLAQSDSRSIAVRNGNTPLLLILNRGIRLIGPDYGEIAAYNHLNQLYTVTWVDFLKENAHYVYGTIFAVVALIITGLLIYLRRIRMAEKKMKIQLEVNRILTEEKEKQIEKISDLNKELQEGQRALQLKESELSKALDAARHANAAKSDFLSRMSHDIRTPLNGIIGLLEISERHKDDEALLEANRRKEKIAANHLLSLINDVLDMSKLEDSTTELPVEPMNLNRVSEEVVMMCLTRARENGIEYSDDRGVNLIYPNVFGSALHFKQIMMNLITNGIKYNKPGGTIRCYSEMVSYDEETVVYDFYIEDTGIGMSSEFQEHIFEPFTQERNDARSRYQGTGMGMAIVKTLVEKMNGKIQVESALGIGTTFVVRLPFKVNPDAETMETGASDPKDLSIEGMRILLVEDNELNQEIAQMILEDAGAVITLAGNGRIACEIFEGQPAGSFDLILMDIMMPELDGYAATERIRVSGKPDAMTIPIVAMTANAFAEDVEKAKQAGMNEHLSKPLEVEKLMRTLAHFYHG